MYGDIDQYESEVPSSPATSSDNIKLLTQCCGHKGFDKKVWEATNITKGENPSITFKYHSSDGEEGYPGDVSVTATNTLTLSTIMRFDMEAVPNKPTPISLAQHIYWNLAGHNSGNVLDHSIQIRANHVTPVDQNPIPTGEIMPVKDTPLISLLRRG
ncbi:uncharacterized protein LOC126704025 [Quercus robur]|uniref:uncharacterized protein LOC126704025 n=1 Tax=Quercus robur TaxID=38942 RepID=UPI00216334AF|nr:uncharacterized protein LOC126704025 [Quercus robur]